MFDKVVEIPRVKLPIRFCLKIATVVGLFLGTSVSARADLNLVLNGDFASGDFIGSGTVANPNWALSGDSSGAYVFGTPGQFAAALTTTSANGSMTQGLTTAIGQQYLVSFVLAGDGSAPNNLVVALGGTTLFTLPNTTSSSYTTESTTYTATSTSSLLSFVFRDDPGYLYVTNISVTAVSAVPEPPTIVGLGLGLLITAGYAGRKRPDSSRTRSA